MGGTRLRRLALYLHAALKSEREAITSADISKATNVNSTQVRRDLTTVTGRTGTRGVGYSRARLAAALQRELEPHVDALKTKADIAKADADALAEVVSRLEQGGSGPPQDSGT